MVTLNHLSVEDPEDGAPLLPEASVPETPTPERHKLRVETKTESKSFFIRRNQNLSLSLVLLVGCYAAILIPAYLPQQKLADEGHQEPKDLVRTDTWKHLEWTFSCVALTCFLQALFNRSAALLSGPCQPNWALDHLKPLPCSTGLQDIPVFVQKNPTKSWDHQPPLGLLGSEKHLAQTLDSLPQPGLPPSLDRKRRCIRCVVVGSGGVLHGSHLGSHIDQYDIIIRLNNAPVLGFERDAGSRTTIRLVYPEAAPHFAHDYRNTSIIALVVFKSLDLDWLTSIITKQPLSLWSRMWFWREVVDDIPLEPVNFRVLNPEIIQRTGQVLQEYAQKQMLPTLGASAVVMALQLCDQVSLAGFGYDMQQPQTRLHYYETIRMGAMKAQVVHDVSAEKHFLRDLVAAGAVTDLTGAI
ncbi:ST3 beta-galactoside alpha-2,3-sialyltransferase 7 isoform X2 [Synchiropus splendidus]|uniref:ST3 beta-galactoside alpha-2,3-sialyltransferase 7 isoform X2 n=1 Tax=Synchiropus splendidus TaxID=270530 RepID=UPI00237DA8D7|nr:ST3 beta-galactoside alpha-2,3-sialyltransferase 7 isoform X2 [Synchiropus splendidus]